MNCAARTMRARSFRNVWMLTWISSAVNHYPPAKAAAWQLLRAIFYYQAGLHICLFNYNFTLNTLIFIHMAKNKCPPY